MEIFWRTIAYYNSATWLLQIVIILIGIALTGIMGSATIPGLYLFFREYFLNNLHADTKPKAKYINWLLISVCVGLAVLLTTTMFLELVPKG